MSDDDAPSLTLSAALKLAGFADTGGQAKRRIQDGEIMVNGAVETRRKRRLREGDEITVDGESFVIELEEHEDEDPEVVGAADPEADGGPPRAD